MQQLGTFGSILAPTVAGLSQPRADNVTTFAYSPPALLIVPSASLKHPILVPDLLATGRDGKSIDAKQTEETSAVDGTPTVDITPYLGILEHRIGDTAEIQLAGQLYREIDPEWSGLLAEVTEEVPHEFVAPRVGKTGATSVGSTRMSFSQSVDRAEAGSAEAIKLARIEGEGTDLLILPHERTHAARYKSLPEEIRRVFVPKPVPRNGRLWETYRVVLENMLMDEAAAFSSELRFAEKFQEKTGRDLYSFKQYSRYKKDHDRFREAYQQKGIQGVFDWVKGSTAYLPYKVAALYIALLAKQGMEEFPKWGDVLKLIGMQETEEGLVLTPDGLRNFYETVLKPLLEKEGVNLSLTVFGLSNEQRSGLFNLMLFLAGAFDPQNAAHFLSKEFDALVPVIGKLMGESCSRSQIRLDLGPDQLLPLIPKEESPKQGKQRETSADKVEIIGSYVGLLHKFEQTSDEKVIGSLESFLAYAEKADPLSQRRIYSRLFALVNADRLALTGDREDHVERLKTERAWAIGLSLGRSGYHKEARHCLQKVLKGLDVEYWSYGHYYRKLKVKMHEAVLVGASDLLEDYLDDLGTRILELNDKERDGLAVILESLVGDLSDEDLSQIPLSLQEKIKQLSEILWESYRKWIEKRIELFKWQYELREQEFGTLDEMMAAAWDPKKLDDSNGIHGFFNESGGNYPMGTSLVKLCLKSPLLFRQGIQFASDYPSSTIQLMLYEEAARTIPASFSDEERFQLVQSYGEVLLAQEKGLKEWGYRENFVDRCLFSSVKSDLPPFEQSGPFQRHTIQMAQVLLGSSRSEERAVGLERIRALAKGDLLVSVEKAHALMETETQYPLEERDVILRQVYSILEPICRNGEHNQLLLTLIKVALSHGCGSLAKEIMGIWQSLEGRRLAHAVFFSGGRDLVGEEFSNLQPFFEELVAGGSGFAKLIQRIQRDVRIGRGLFSLKQLIEGLKFLGQKEIAKQIPNAEALFNDLARATIDLYIQSIGQKDKEGFLTSGWEPLVNTLKGLPVSASVKDSLFTYLVRRATPEPGLFVSEVEGFETIWEGYQYLDFILGNSETPRAEAILLDRITHFLKKHQHEVSNLSEGGLLKALQWVFGRVADDSVFDPKNRRRLAALRESASYREALDKIYLFTQEERPQRDPQEIIADYKDAVRKRDAHSIRAISAEIAPLIDIDFKTSTKSSEGLIMRQRDSLNSFYGVIYKDWQDARQKGRSEFAEALFDLWVPRRDVGQRKSREVQYEKELGNEDLSLEEKRRIFEEFSKTTSISRYSRYAWKKLIEEQKEEREALFYQMFPLGRPSDSLLDIVVEGSRDEVKAAVEACRGPKDLGREFDLENPFHWELVWAGADMVHHPPEVLYLYLLAARHGLLDELVQECERAAMNAPQKGLFLMGGQPLSFIDFHKKHVPKQFFEFFSEKISTLIEREVLPFLNKYAPLLEPDDITPADMGRKFLWWHEKITPDQAAQLIKQYEPRLRSHLKRQDRIRLAGFEMPEIFDDGRPLVDFIWSRYFAYLPLGAQQEILSEARGKSRQEALRIFFEKERLIKFAQLMSYWMEVPKDYRDQLVDMQDRVERSDFEEVKKTIARALGPSMEPKSPQVITEAIQTYWEKVIGAPSNGTKNNGLSNPAIGISSHMSELLGFIEIFKNGGESGRTRILTREDFDAIISNLVPKPLGSGSIGECYRSKLSDGTPVVVKVITESSEKKTKVGLERCQRLLKLLDLYGEEIPGAREAHRVLKMFLGIIEKEFDLRVEQDNAERARQSLPDGIDIPKNYFASQRVMIQEYVEGKRVDKIADPAVQRRVVEGLRSFFLFIQVLQTGFYHSDPQLGNILVPETGEKTWLLDFGQVGFLSESERGIVNDFITAARSGEASNIVRVLEKMAEERLNYDPKSLVQNIDALMQDMVLHIDGLSEVVSQLFKACHDSGLIIDLTYLQLLKALATLEATGNAATTT